jgi:glycerophosphoryl diester phosphodiesterase
MPENTLAGIDAAIRDGVDGVEIDVRATADGRVVLLHDASLERTTGDPRPLASVTLAELATVRVTPVHGHPSAEPVPALEDALDRMDGHGVLVIEVKDTGIEAAVAAAVRARGAAERCWVWAFDPAVAVACRGALPEVPVALLAGPRSAEQYGYLSALEAAAAASLAAVSLHHSMVDRQTVEAAHARGLRVYTWTVNEAVDVHRVLAAGVDAICGDFPRRISEAIRVERG